MLNGITELWDYRGCVAELYAQVRGIDDPEQAWHYWRRMRDRLFRHHPQSALAPSARQKIDSLSYFNYDPAYRFRVALETPVDQTPQTTALGSDGELTLVPFARTSGLAPSLGGELVLYWVHGYGGGVFLPFRDATADSGTTFTGGRYLLDTVKGADLGYVDGRAVVDFNFAYNPSCAYDGRWICPLATPENRLANLVEAGEKVPTDR